MCVESAVQFTRDLQRVRTTQRTCKRCADLTGNARVIPTVTLGREQPPEQGSGSHPRADRGVAHAPAPSGTTAKCVSCAAQNAALLVLPLGLQVVRVERLAQSGFEDAGSSAIGFD